MKVSRHSLIFGLSYALDIAGKDNLSHSKNTAYISAMICGEIGLDAVTTLDVYYAALLHDIGASNEYLLNEHCDIGAAMLKKLPLSEEIPKFVLYHHELFGGSGPQGLSGSDIPMGSRIICFASAFDEMFGKSESFDRDLFLDVNNWLDENRMLFAEEITRAFESLIKREFFLLDYFNHKTKHMLSEKIAADNDIFFGFGDIEKFALCFAGIIDRRSPFTFSHSTGIAALAKKAAASLGYSTGIQNKMYLAGLLHDLGKLRISIDILHKNGKLTPEERFEMNKHTYYTRKILEQIEGFEDVAEFAANHHEKLNGSGYPYRMTSEQLGELERIMAICDVYQALSEERPYRAKLSPEKVWRLIDGMVEKKHLDGELVHIFKQIFDNSSKKSDLVQNTNSKKRYDNLGRVA